MTLLKTEGLSRSFGISCTAEGIENIRQAAILREAGCDQLQGYLIGRPMSALDISSKLQEQAA